MSRCSKCPTLNWLIVQVSFVAFIILVIILILLRDERKEKNKKRTLTDVVLARLKIVIGFYQVGVTMVTRWNNDHHDNMSEQK